MRSRASLVVLALVLIPALAPAQGFPGRRGGMGGGGRGGRGGIRRPGDDRTAVVETPAPPKGFQVVPPPVSVPTNLPAIDLSKVATNESDFSGKGVAGGKSNGVEGGTGKEGDTGKEAGAKEENHGPYMEFQVEKPVEKIGGDSPEYPSALRESGVEGQVLAQFVVNESGRAEMGTLKILNSSNPQFTAAVKNALPRMKFSAAQIGGKKVQQLVQMPFQFHLSK